MIWRVPTLILIGSLSGAIGLWVADRDPPVSQIQEKEVLTSTVDPGGSLLVRFHVQRRKSCETRVERVLVDSTGIRYVLNAQEFVSIPANNGPETYTAKIEIPTDIQPGPTIYRAVATYTCNPVHRLFWPVRSSVVEVRFVVRSLQDQFSQPPKK